jgi:hypothetical protein
MRPESNSDGFPAHIESSSPKAPREGREGNACPHPFAQHPLQMCYPGGECSETGLMLILGKGLTSKNAVFTFLN